MRNASQRRNRVEELLDALRAAATHEAHDAQRMRDLVTRYEEMALQTAATMEEYSRAIAKKVRALRRKAATRAQLDAHEAKILRALEHATDWTWRHCHMSTMHMRATAKEFVRTMHQRSGSDMAAAVDRECERLRRCGDEKERAATLELFELWERRLEPHDHDVKLTIERAADALGVHERGSNTPPRSGETSRGKRHRRAQQAQQQQAQQQQAQQQQAQQQQQDDAAATAAGGENDGHSNTVATLADAAKRMMREIFERQPYDDDNDPGVPVSGADRRIATRRQAVLDYLAEEHPALVQHGGKTMLGAVALVDRVRVENIHAHLQEALREPDDWQSDPVGRRIRAKMLEHLRRGGGRYDRLRLTELTRRLRKGDRSDPDLGAETRRDVERWAFQVVASIAHLEKDPVDHRVYATVRSHLY